MKNPKVISGLGVLVKDRKTLSQEVWRDLAGAVYEELIQSKHGALKNLGSENPDVRIAAIEVGRTIWDGATDVTFLNACQTLAASDPIDAVRVYAIAAIGRAFQSSRSPSLSHFLAGVIADMKNSEEVRQSAYWALREIQFGLVEEDIVRQNVALTKTLLAKGMAMEINEEEVKATLLCGGRFPDAVWNCATEIDWDFVNHFLKRKDDTAL